MFRFQTLYLTHNVGYLLVNCSRLFLHLFVFLLQLFQVLFSCSESIVCTKLTLFLVDETTSKCTFPAAQVTIKSDRIKVTPCAPCCSYINRTCKELTGEDMLHGTTDDWVKCNALLHEWRNVSTLGVANTIDLQLVEGKESYTSKFLLLQTLHDSCSSIICIDNNVE